MMKRTWILFAAAIPAFAQQSFDFKSLDKLGANATGSTNITLEGDTLKLATSFLGDDKSVFRNLTGVYVRSFEFDKFASSKKRISPRFGLISKPSNGAKSSTRKTPMRPAKSISSRCRTIAWAVSRLSPPNPKS